MTLTSAVVRRYMANARGEHRSFAWSFLKPAAFVTRLTASALDFLFSHGLRRVTEPPLPLISVGNLTYGGTNKTPFVEMLAREMSSRGIKTGVVSRGYSGALNEAAVVRGGAGDRHAVGDEPLLLSGHMPDVPVAVSRYRINGVRALLDEGAELVIADDAFQHRSLGRDVNILLIDAACPFGNGELIPLGIMREPVSAAARADIVVLTKADQVPPSALSDLRGTVEKYVRPDRVFTSVVSVGHWKTFGWGRDGELIPCDAPMRGTRVLAFSAIGNPRSFIGSLEAAGLDVAAEFSFRDHHRYTAAELACMCGEAERLGAAAMTCTEKDLFNLPNGWRPGIPVIVPCVSAVPDDPERFFSLLAELMRPRIVVASNGYGEDAIGVVLARRLRDRFPSADVMAFPLVGRGDAYSEAGFEVVSAPSVTPSGGVVKYRLRDLWGDMRAGLLKHVRAQFGSWRDIRGTIRTPMCVGDVYLLMHSLLGSGLRPLFAATAKTVRLSGHWRLERALIRRFALRVWTRDEGSAEQLRRSFGLFNRLFSGLFRIGAADAKNSPMAETMPMAETPPMAVFAGSPIMDLLEDKDSVFSPLMPPERTVKPLILLLPGSRLRAYDDVNMLLDAAERLNAMRECDFRMVLAPTISAERLLESCAGWAEDGDEICRGDTRVCLTSAPVADAAAGVSLLIGLGGTANQLCAGMGIPVVSIDEKGKRVQKKLLGDSEILVEATPEALADAAVRVLSDGELYRAMSTAGIERMGSPGALADMAEYAASRLGWDARENVCRKLAQSAAISVGAHLQEQNKINSKII